jgi:Leucine-rich repeat (LRR) protein
MIFSNQDIDEFYHQKPSRLRDRIRVLKAFQISFISRAFAPLNTSKLRVLSLGRNNIKKLEKLEDVASSLEQLWISYNQISSLDGIACLVNLHTLYMSNNAIKSFSELVHLVRYHMMYSHIENQIGCNDVI